MTTIGISRYSKEGYPYFHVNTRTSTNNDRRAGFGNREYDGLVPFIKLMSPERYDRRIGKTTRRK